MVGHAIDFSKRRLEYDAHPVLQAFPLLTGDAYERFVDDIRVNGLRWPIVLWRRPKRLTMIIDGRLRWHACIDAGVEPRFSDFAGDEHDAFAFICSVNLARRHLNDSQRALVAARLKGLAPGRPSKNPAPGAGISQARAAELLRVDERSIRDAKLVEQHAIPAILEAVDQGNMPLSTARELARLPKAEQRTALAAAATSSDARGHLQRLALERRPAMSTSVRITEMDLVALNALVALGDASRDPRARAGALVVRRMMPAVKART